ncbi:2791_t:CDS:2 [Funneliformis geosporum]|uniref:2791_t:CDS:1 n=1 Tax=Funneliformis geosporum TaxID=1117311 RepID=A0A9W4T019_9GLOM|nr:2791_t:CDS:2 [Funneliformis geosporum]
MSNSENQTINETASIRSSRDNENNIFKVLENNVNDIEEDDDEVKLYLQQKKLD